MSLQPEKQSRGPADGPDTGSLESNAESTATHLGVVRAHSLDDFMKKKSTTDLYNAWKKGHQHWLAKTKKSVQEAEDEGIQTPTETGIIEVEDVLKVVDNLQEQLRHRVTYKVAQRMSPFVAGIDAYGTALTTYANASSSIMSPLWGSVQVLFIISAGVLDSFDSLLDMLQDISENLPRFNQYATVFKGRTMFEAALILVYNDIACFLIQAIHFYCRRGISTLWRGLWRPFKEDFGQILTQLRKHIALVDKEASLAGFVEHQETQQAIFHTLERHVRDAIRYRQTTISQLESTREVMDALQLREVTRWLSPVMPQADFEQAQRKMNQSTGSWLLNTDEFNAWILAPKNKVLPILWVHGAPGCGKTILAARIILHLEEVMRARKSDDDRYMLGHFFCDHKDTAKTSRLAIAKSLVGQILASNINLLPFGVMAMKESGEEEVTCAPRLLSLIKDLLTTFADSFFVLDGIDECTIQEREALLRDLHDLASSSETMKVIILSRHQSDIGKALASYPSYAITSNDTSPDIARFVSDALDDSTTFKFNLQAPLKSDVQRRLSETANGNFLWVRLMIDTLKSEPLDDFNQVRDAVMNLPLGLGAAYGRVLHAVLQQSQPKQELTKLVLQLLSIAFRPLTVSSLLLALTVHGDVKLAALTRKDNFRTLLDDTLGCIIQFGEDETVTFIHQTVMEFLTSNVELWSMDNEKIARFRVEPTLAHGVMAVRCLDVLQSTPFAVEGDVVSLPHEQNDYTSYALRYWGEHVSMSVIASHDTVVAVQRFLASNQALYWLKERLQAHTKVALIIGQLVVLEHKLKQWASSKADNNEIQQATDNLVQRLYGKWHQKLVLQYGDRHDFVLRSSNLLGQILTNKGSYNEATSVFESNIAIAEDSAEKKGLTYLDSLLGLAQVRQFQGNWEGAITLYSDSVDGYKTQLSPRDPKTLTAMGMLGAALVGGAKHRLDKPEQETLAEAETILLEALSMRTEILGAEHPDTLDSLQTMAKLYSFQGRFEDSRDAFSRHQELAKKVLGSEHRNYQHSMDDLGLLYQNNGKPKEAEAVFETVLASHRAIQADKHPDTAWSAWRLGVLLREQGQYERATECFLPLAEISEQTYGRTHRYCLMSKYQLGLCYAALHQDALAQPLLEHVVDNCDFTNKVSVGMGEKSGQALGNIYERSGHRRKANMIRRRSWNVSKEPKPKRTPLSRSGWLPYGLHSAFNTRFLMTVLAIVLLWLFLPDLVSLGFPRSWWTGHNTMAPSLGD